MEHDSIREQKRFYIDRGAQVKVRPDVTLQRGRQSIFVLDAKYKLDPERGDIYQVLAYCHALVLEEVALVYPLGESAPSGRLLIREPGNLRIHYLGLDLSGDPQAILEAGERLAEQVSRLIHYGHSGEDQPVAYAVRA